MFEGYDNTVLLFVTKEKIWKKKHRNTCINPDKKINKVKQTHKKHDHKKKLKKNYLKKTLIIKRRERRRLD